MKSYVTKKMVQDSFLYFFILLFSNVFAQNTPPSCVITQPHSNAYFQADSNVVITAFSTDFGGTRIGGTVTKVEFYNGATKLGEDLNAINYTYSYTWQNVQAGPYTITAVATNSFGTKFTSAGVKFIVGTAPATPKGMSACKGKYLANISSSRGTSIRSDYNTYWNGMTSEDACKWGSIEGTRDVMNWGGASASYNYAKANNLMFRYHAIAWGNQYPKWLEGLNPTEFKAEVEEYMSAIATKFPDGIDQFDVLNEQLTDNGNPHAPGTIYFENGLGGKGVTGYDWQIWLFTKARQYFPNSKLILNDYSLERNNVNIDNMLKLVKVLRDRGLIDGFGTQAHWFSLEFNTDPASLKTSLTRMAGGGIPIYVTELDITGHVSNTSKTEAKQLENMTKIFPAYWEHPAVAGITYWGNVLGSTWVEGSGLINPDGTPRSALTWLKNYMAGQTNVGYPFCNANINNPIPTITASATSFCTGSSVTLTSSNGTSFKWFRGTTQVATTKSYTATQGGAYKVEVSYATGANETSAPIAITENALPAATITSSSSSFCNGESLVLTSSSGTSYKWFKGGVDAGITTKTHAVKTGGSYRVEVTNGAGCKQLSDAYVVSVNAIPTVKITNPTKDTSVTVGSILVKSSSTSTNLSSVKYFTNGVLIQTLSSAPYFQTVNLPTLKTYNVKVVATNTLNCTSADSVKITKTLSTNVENEQYYLSEVSIYPNPSIDGKFQLSKVVNWKVYNLQGIELKVGNSNQINLSEEPKGVYLIKVNEKMERVVVE